MKKLTVRSIVAIGIGAALFFVLGRFVTIPSSVPNTNIGLQYGVLAFISAVYGPTPGLLVGFICHCLIDSTRGNIWFSWVIASALFGGMMGFIATKLHIKEGNFKWKDIMTFNVAQIICHAIAWGVIAPVLDIVIYAEDSSKVFTQGLVAGAANIVSTLVVGTLLCVAFVAAVPKKGSLKKKGCT